MGFTAIIDFAFICFDAFAWPVFALGYPLRASIQAIEGNSNSDTKKLVTYWVIFSLISLFEHAFMGLLQWLPLWPYIKLIIVCWLMIPHFDGALYVYNHFVHPCVYVDLQTIINWFEKQQQLFVKENFVGEADRPVKLHGPEPLEKQQQLFVKDNFVGEADRSVKLHGPEALEKLLPKESNGREPSMLQKHIMPAPVTEKREVAAVNWIPETAQAQANMKMLAVAGSAMGSEMKETTGLVGVAELGSENEKQQQLQVQKEWSCAMCQVTTSSEKSLNNHLHGSKHKAALEVLMLPKSKPKNQPTKLPLTTPKKHQTPKPQVSAASDPVAKNSHHPNIRVPVTETGSKPGDPGKKSGELKNGLLSKPQVVAKNSHHPNISVPVTETRTKPSGKKPGEFKKDLPFRCTICNIGCTRSADLNFHLWGKKHMARIQELNLPNGWI